MAKKSLSAVGIKSMGAKLRAKGIIPDSYDFRKPLTKWQKENINAKARAFEDYIKHPDRYHSAHVSKSTANLLRVSAFKVAPNNRAVIPKDGYDKIKIKNGKITYDKKDMREVVTLAKSKDFHSTLLKLTKRKLTHNQMLTVKVGETRTFKRRFKSMAELERYVISEMVYPNNNREELQALMSVVTVYGEEQSEHIGKTEKLHKAVGFKIDNDTGEILDYQPTRVYKDGKIVRQPRKQPNAKKSKTVKKRKPNNRGNRH